MNKRSYLILDLVRSKVLDLNPTESILASCFFGLLSQNPIQYGGKPYYMADYKNVACYCSILPDKIDTLRRLYKRLENLGLITLIKIDNHVCFTPSQMLRDWGTVHKSEEAEKNPIIPGQNPEEAEKKPEEAEKNPVYINNNNINNYNKEAPKQSLDATLFPETEEVKEDKAKKTLFANCVWADMNKFIDYFKSQPGMENVDLVYYYHSVSDWSDSKNMKRTARGWLATVRQFMRSDNEKGKLKLNKSASKQQQDMKYEGATEYLKDFD